MCPLNRGRFNIIQRPSFEGPSNGTITEIHTAVADLEMTDGSGFISIKAGHGLGIGLLLSPGEVESKTPPNFDTLPGESFFNVYIEATFPTEQGPAVVRNSSPLLIVNDNLDSLPPTVVYIHENSTAVPVYFYNSNPPYWNASDLLGYLVLAGHGYDFGPNKAGTLNEFRTIMNAQQEMPLPSIPTLTEWGMIILLLLLLGSGAWVIVRRRKTVKVRI